MTRLAPIYGFDEVPESVVPEGSGREHGSLGEATGFDGDLGRIELMLQEALAASPLPAEAPNTDVDPPIGTVQGSPVSQ